LIFIFGLDKNGGRNARRPIFLPIIKLAIAKEIKFGKNIKATMGMGGGCIYFISALISLFIFRAEAKAAKIKEIWPGNKRAENKIICGGLIAAQSKK